MNYSLVVAALLGYVTASQSDELVQLESKRSMFARRIGQCKNDLGTRQKMADMDEHMKFMFKSCAFEMPKHRQCIKSCLGKSKCVKTCTDNLKNRVAHIKETEIIADKIMNLMNSAKELTVKAAEKFKESNEHAKVQATKKLAMQYYEKLSEKTSQEAVEVSTKAKNEKFVINTNVDSQRAYDIEKNKAKELMNDLMQKAEKLEFNMSQDQYNFKDA